VDRGTAYTQSLAQRDQINAQVQMQEISLKRQLAEIQRELAVLDYANQRNISLDKVKAELAKSTMQLNTQKELAGMVDPNKVHQVAPTGMEPAGRAPNGEAFQK